MNMNLRTEEIKALTGESFSENISKLINSTLLEFSFFCEQIIRVLCANLSCTNLESFSMYIATN